MMKTKTQSYLFFSLFSILVLSSLFYFPNILGISNGNSAESAIIPQAPILEIVIIDQATQEPLVGYSNLYLFDSEGNNVREPNSSYFIPAGELSIEGLAPGVYYPWLFIHSDYTAGYTTINYHDPTKTSSIVVDDTGVQTYEFEVYRGGKISGTLIDENNFPFRYGDVNLYQTDQEGNRHWLKTDEIGHGGDYFFGGLNPNYEYLVEVVPDIIEEFENQYGPKTAPNISVTKGEKTVVDFNLSEGSTISGKITSAGSGDPIETQVVFFRWNNQPNIATPYEPIATLASDEGGVYKSPILEKGTYFVKVLPTAANKGEFYDGGEFHDSQEQYELIRNATPIVIGTEPNIEINFVIDPQIDPNFTGQIKGFIDSASQFEEGQGDASIGLYKLENEELVLVKQIRAENSSETWGEYVLSNLEDGEYYLKITDYGHKTVWYGGTQFYEDSQSIIINDGSQLEGIDFLLELGGSITGNIHQTAYQSVPFEVVRYNFNKVGLYDGEQNLVTEGYQGISWYTFLGLWPGEYYVVFHDYTYTVEGTDIVQMYNGQWYGGESTIEEATSLVITSTTTYQDIDGFINKNNSPLLLPGDTPAEYVLAGRVLDTNGQPVEGIVVTAETGRQAGTSTVTNNDGEYSLNLQDGVYTISFSKAGYDFSQASFDVTIDGDAQNADDTLAIEEIELTPTPSPTLIPTQTPSPLPQPTATPNPTNQTDKFTYLPWIGR